MNYLHPPRLDRLAREYALGTLTGRARRRFERVLRQAPAASQAVAAWQERFSVLAAAVPPMQPREAVWHGLERRLFDSAARADEPAARPLQWLWTLVSGRLWAGALAGALLAVVVLRTQPEWAGLESADRALPESYVGLLLDPAGQPALLANSRRHGRQLTVKVLQPVTVPAGQVAQLWAFPARGAPFPVAPLPPLPGRGASVTLTLPDTSEKLFANVPRLGVTFEATPANPGETLRRDPVLAGHCVKLW